LLAARGNDADGDLLLAAFVAYLGRISGSYTFDLAFGRRNLSSRIPWMPAVFAARVPLHVELNPGAGFEAAQQALHDELVLIERRKTYARDVILRYPGLRPLRTRGGSSPAPVTIERLTSDENPSAAPGSLLTVRIPDDGQELHWVYDQTALDGELVEGMQRQFLTFLEHALADTRRPLGDIPVLQEAERRQLLAQWNDTRVDYPQDRCIQQWFEAQARQTPEAAAVVFEGQQFTYRELDGRANQLARLLQSWGVGPEVPVGVALERSLEMVVGLYAILKAGGAYMPLDPAYPAERLAYMAQEAGVRVVLTQARLRDRLPRFDGQVLCLDTDWPDRVAYQSPENPVCGATLENAAYIIYTSGSAGRPKGVVNTHRGILNRLLWMQEAYRLIAADRVLQKTPFSFDVSVWEFFWPLMFGARLVVARPEGHKDSEYLARTIREQGITVVHFVPSMLQLFLEARDVERCDSLRHVVCSGEALSVNLQDRFFGRLGARLHNLYGPTEAAVDVTYWECRPDSHLKTVPIGRPVANTRMYILDHGMQPVPIGIPGELHIGGVQVARGYISRPDLTAEKFIPDPFCDDPTARLYKTGDLARYLPDGNIEYLGRLDHQVKVRGLRIELAEIESVLTRHPAVREAVVIAREDTPGDKRLAAYVVFRTGSPPRSSELRDHLRRSLPDHMVPAVFIALEALPLTSSGKVDRRNLPAPREQPRSEEAYLAPRNGLEKAIAEIWRDLLRVEQVGIGDNFFDLGGHSLLIVQAHQRLRAITDKELSVADLFRFTTIRALAEHLGAAAGEEGTQAQVAARRSMDRARARRTALRQRWQSR
jgi:amino acid adenylation domain-containing protein